MIDMFPLEFDAAFYRGHYPDLRRFNHTDLERHWAEHGKREGRQGNHLANRRDFIGLIPHNSSILEIGPFNAPMTAGAAVRYFDVLDSRGLALRAKEIGLDPRNIPHIDFVSPDGDLGVVTQKFDYVLSSHCLEHQPDPIRHLLEVANSLHEGGYYFVLIPDKRFCFDHYIPETNLAQLIEAFRTKQKRHSLRSVIEHRALTTHNDSARHWRGDHGPKYTDVKRRCEGAIVEYEQAAGAYIDVHGWYFTPETFRELITELKTAGYISLRMKRLYSTLVGANEFWAILQNCLE